ncbi:MAG TPA: restriction endonuclease [Chiayiivirga sp.]|nr:restriction endonuclease [Chiayiivirga sp.]
MGFFYILTQPWLLAFLALAIVFVGYAWFSGAFRTEREEARAGLVLLCAMRWGEYSRLISEALKDRGLEPSNTDRPPGKDGFDLLFTRGNSRYLVQCANAANQRISATTVGQLYTLTQMQDADGAIIASCAAAEPAALKLAQDRRIEIIAERDLWSHVKPWVAYDQRSDAEATARTMQRQRLLAAALAGLIAAVVTFALAAFLRPTPVLPPPTPVATPSATPRALSPKPAANSPDLPDVSLSAEQLSARRASAVLEVRSLARVNGATWSSQSTLQVGLHTGLSDKDLDKLVTDVCGSLLQYEELRFTRLQVEVPNATPGQAPVVRWRQCR